MGGMVVWLVAPFPIPMAGLKRARVQVGHAIHECCHWCRGSWAGSLFGDHSGMKGDPIVGKAFLRQSGKPIHTRFLFLKVSKT